MKFFIIQLYRIGYPNITKFVKYYADFAEVFKKFDFPYGKINSMIDSIEDFARSLMQLS